MDWHSLRIEEVLKALESRENGLSEEEAEKRLMVFGFNELKEKKQFSAARLFFQQFNSFLIWILLFAVLVAFFVGEFVDAGVIALIIVVNAFLGFAQEFKAEKAMQALKKLSAPKAKVLRQGAWKHLSSRLLVPGDVVEVEQGDIVAADSRILQAVNLRIDESSLTGESSPVGKQEKEVKEEAGVAERKCIAFFGTTVSFGRGKAVVVSTGMNTEFGKIAEKIQEIEEEKTPLALKLDSLGKKIGFAVIAIAVVLMALIFLQEGEIVEALLVSISLAVAAVPEGLPAVVTITLALGISAMAKRKAVVRKISAVETLGNTTVVCSDKTGTLTRNEMNVTTIYANGKEYEVEGYGYGTEGKILLEGKKVEEMDKELELLLKDCLLCNNAKIGREFFGDPTEIALLVVAKKAGIEKNEQFLKEEPFDSARKRMSVVYEFEERRMLYCKGAVETVLDVCSKYMEDGKEKELGLSKKREFLKKNEELAAKGLRVLGFAVKESWEEERDLVFLGMLGMIDSPRKESKEAIALCKQAGIDVKMITGDHKLTAIAIARSLYLNEKALEGKEIAKMKEEVLRNAVKEYGVFARVNPEDKYRIVEALKKNGEVVAVTGDGVNDALALKKADIGVAMGITGTDVAKQASEIVIEDDNFATIVQAVRQGRKVYANIKNFVKYLLSANAGEVIIVAGAVVVGMPLPLLPVQILWLNLVTDGLPALALGREELEKEVMKEKPRKKNEGILKGMPLFIIISGIVSTVAVLLVFEEYLSFGVEKARTMAFASLVLFELVLVFSCRSEKHSALSMNPFSNKYLVLAVLASAAMLFLAISVPEFDLLFKTTELGLWEWAVVALAALSALTVPVIHGIVERFIPLSRSRQSM